MGLLFRNGTFNSRLGYQSEHASRDHSVATLTTLPDSIASAADDERSISEDDDGEVEVGAQIR